MHTPAAAERWATSLESSILAMLYHQPPLDLVSFFYSPETIISRVHKRIQLEAKIIDDSEVVNVLG